MQMASRQCLIAALIDATMLPFSILLKEWPRIYGCKVALGFAVEMKNNNGRRERTSPANDNKFEIVLIKLDLERVSRVNAIPSYPTLDYS